MYAVNLRKVRFVMQSKESKIKELALGVLKTFCDQCNDLGFFKMGKFNPNTGVELTQKCDCPDPIKVSLKILKEAMALQCEEIAKEFEELYTKDRRNSDLYDSGKDAALDAVIVILEEKAEELRGE